jgi:hypothetical protein
MHVTSGNHSPLLRRYYKTQAWKDLSYQAKKRDNFRCVACEKKPQHRKWYEIWRRKDWLVAHHMSYVAWERNPGHEPLSDLVSLCRSDHDEVHARHRAGHFGGHEDSLRAATQYVIDLHQRKLARRRAKMQRKLATS